MSNDHSKATKQGRPKLKIRLAPDMVDLLDKRRQQGLLAQYPGPIAKLRRQGKISRKTLLKAARLAGIEPIKDGVHLTELILKLTSEARDAFLAINDDDVRISLVPLIAKRESVDETTVNELAVEVLQQLDEPVCDDPKAAYTQLQVGQLARRIRTAHERLAADLPNLMVDPESRPKWIDIADLQLLGGRLQLAAEVFPGTAWGADKRSHRASQVEDGRRYLATLRRSASDALRMAVGVGLVQRHQELLTDRPPGLRTELWRQAEQARLQAQAATGVRPALLAAARSAMG